MKIFNNEGEEIQGVFAFWHKGSEISITTLTEPAEIVVFRGAQSIGPMSNMADAIEIAEHLFRNSVIDGSYHA